MQEPVSFGASLYYKNNKKAASHRERYTPQAHHSMNAGTAEDMCPDMCYKQDNLAENYCVD